MNPELALPHDWWRLNQGEHSAEDLLQLADRHGSFVTRGALQLAHRRILFKLEDVAVEVDAGVILPRAGNDDLPAGHQASHHGTLNRRKPAARGLLIELFPGGHRAAL